eukprot:3767660-Prymnesium_polylepis.1
MWSPAWPPGPALAAAAVRPAQGQRSQHALPSHACVPCCATCCAPRSGTCTGTASWMEPQPFAHVLYSFGAALRKQKIT